MLLPGDASSLRVLARGDDWLAVDKEAGRHVRPRAVGETDTLLNALYAAHPCVLGVGEGGLKSGVVHRLDRDTSGVTLFALNQSKWEELRLAFSQHQIEKVYFAIVWRKRVHADVSGDFSHDMQVTRHAPARVGFVAHGIQSVQSSRAHAVGYPTRLSWAIEEVLSDTYALVRVNLVTGFLHQVRATLAHLGLPVVGDSTYSAPNELRTNRCLLHAYSLKWNWLDVKAELPEDFRAALAKCRSRPSTRI